MGLYDKLSKSVKDKVATVKEGNKEVDDLGPALTARAQNSRDVKPTPAPARDTSGAGVGGTAKPYGSQSGEKRIDTSSYTKPLGSYKKGTKRVPKTGTYKLHKGEAVLTKKQNATAKKKGFSKLFGGK